LICIKYSHVKHVKHGLPKHAPVLISPPPHGYHALLSRRSNSIIPDENTAYSVSNGLDYRSKREEEGYMKDGGGMHVSC
jgi:hypothetical protein